MTPIDRIKSLCKDKKIAISKLEKDLGYSNGYIRNLKKGVLPADKMKEVADYLDVPVTYLIVGSDLDTSRNEEYAHLVGKLRQDPEMANALKKYFALSIEKRNHIIELIELLSE